MKRILFCLCVPLLFAQDKPDLSVINRIKAEAFQNSKVMEHSFYLSDVYGPRLAGSPAYKAAADWAVRRLEESRPVRARTWKNGDRTGGAGPTCVSTPP